MNENAPLHLSNDESAPADDDAIVVAKTAAGGALAAALPRLALRGDQLEIWNALQRMEGKAVSIGPLQVIYTQRPTGGDGAFRHQIAWKDGLGDVRTLVALEEFSFRETHGADINVDTLALMPPALAAVLEKSAIDVIAERLQQAGLRGRHVETAGRPPEADSIEVKVRIGGLFSEPVGVRLRGTPSALIGITEAKTLLSLRAAPEISSDIRLPARIELSAVVLPAADVAGLETGDVLLLAEEADSTWVTIVAAGRRHLAAHHEDRWIIREISMGNEDPRIEAEEADLAAGGAIDQLPVRVHVELATLDLPIAELGAWGPGTLVDIGLGPLANGLPVTLRVGARKLASGNLITIDDRFAVRLSGLATDPLKR